ncbi:TetR/AcrR family transcriptional regulator [Acinetobacter lactucae]|uniref:TetR/AcrR family transcriptional regulator n=1 Tax=Acinetobacter lactucae TaxID=1785128 RepID=UPI00358DC8E9
MRIKKLSKLPGRPRQFDPEKLLNIAQELFHSRGYDAVSIAEITTTLGINPPSFYSIFDSKIGLYTRVLERYSDIDAIPLADILIEERPIRECLIEILEEAARRYASNATCKGCLVLEGLRSKDADARNIASTFYVRAEETIFQFIAKSHPQNARRLTDFIGSIMLGLSAKARQNCSVDQLLEVAHLAGAALIFE